MGLLAQRWEERGRSVAEWMDDDSDLIGLPTSSGIRVGVPEAFSLSTFWRCIDLLTSSVAMSPADLYLKIGNQSYEEFTKPSWMSAPEPGNPTFLFADYLGQCALSTLIDGNYFVKVHPHVWEPQRLTVLNPLRVTPKPGPVWEVRDERGSLVETLGPSQILHGKWLPLLPGRLRSLNPVSTLSRELGAAIASEEFAGRFFGQGSILSFGVEVPGTLTDTQRDDLRDSLRAKYQGLRKSHGVGILTGGATFKQLQTTPEQAQMLDTRKFAVITTCRPFGVPPVLAGVNDPGSTSYASADLLVNTMYQRNAVAPLVSRLEGQHNRLLEDAVPARITDPSARMQFRLNLDWIVRTDLLARMQAHGEGVTKGVLTPNEARAKEDLAPLQGGDHLYMQQQMVPITSLGTPSGNGG